MQMTAGEELRHEGRVEQRLEIVKRLLASGINREAIEFATGFSEDRIRNIKITLATRREMAKRLIELGIDSERVYRVTNLSSKDLS